MTYQQIEQVKLIYLLKKHLLTLKAKHKNVKISNKNWKRFKRAYFDRYLLTVFDLMKWYYPPSLINEMIHHENPLLKKMPKADWQGAHVKVPKIVTQA